MMEVHYSSPASFFLFFFFELPMFETSPVFFWWTMNLV